MSQGRLAKAIGLAALFMAMGANAQAEAPKVDAVPGEYIVKLKDQFSFMAADQVARALGTEKVEFITPQSRTVKVTRAIGENRTFALKSLGKSDLVEYVEPNYIYTINAVPNDPKLGELWGMINTGNNIDGVQGVENVDIDADQAWDITTGSRDVIVAVVDTGVDYTIDDLKDNMWVNEAEKNGQAGVDDDGNGYVDDVHGYDFANNDGDPKDDHGHGSHCSGTIGASGNNGIGVVGVAWNVRIMGIKFLTRSGGGSLEDAIKSIDYATANGAHVMNNSWGGGGYSEALKEAIQRSRDAGVLFVAAAGNSRSNNDSAPTYPASYDVDNIVSVAAIDNAGQLASFSSYGRTSVHVAAPGVGILSTTPNGLVAWDGTSMAAPHVSGVAALVLSHEPDLGMAGVRERIINTARPLAGLQGKVASNGLVNAHFALTNTTPPPDPNDPSRWDSKSESISTAHPYADNFSNTWTVKVEGASKVAVHFSRFETESGYDKVTFKDGSGKTVAVWSGDYSDSFGPVVDGDTVTITFTSDGSVNRYGFDIDAVAYK